MYDDPETTKTYSLGDEEYKIQLMLCEESDSSCKLRINEVPTVKLREGSEYDLGSDFYLKIDKIEFGFCDNIQFCNRPYDDYDILTFSIISEKSFCGDDSCDSGEDCISCTEDCEICPDECGDGICSPGGPDGRFDLPGPEDCEADSCCQGKIVNLNTNLNNCGKCRNTCKIREICVNGTCQTKSSCGNNNCDNDEDCSSCTLDCSCGATMKCEDKKCKSFCGNGICDSGETCDTCQQDCGKCKTCGDGICSIEENCSSCNTDCVCNNSTDPMCRDDTCSASETCTNCPTDCNCSEGYTCINSTCINQECSVNSDCNDNKEYTEDYCTSNKSCVHNTTGCVLEGAHINKEGICEKESLFTRIKSWILEIFN